MNWRVIECGYYNVWARPLHQDCVIYCVLSSDMQLWIMTVFDLDEFLKTVCFYESNGRIGIVYLMLFKGYMANGDWLNCRSILMNWSNLKFFKPFSLPKKKKEAKFHFMTQKLSRPVEDLEYLIWSYLTHKNAEFVFGAENYSKFTFLRKWRIENYFLTWEIVTEFDVWCEKNAHMIRISTRNV